jgi:hypothetical protein
MSRRRNGRLPREKLEQAVLGQFAAQAETQKAKALLRLLIEELRVNDRAEIQPTYRVVTPAVCAMSERVEAAGIEPTSDSSAARLGDLADGLAGTSLSGE